MNTFLLVLISIISVIIGCYLLYLWIKVLVSLDLWLSSKAYESKQNAENIKLQNKLLQNKIKKLIKLKDNIKNDI